MAIHPESDRVFFSGRPRQREIALRLDEAFDVTFGDLHGELFLWLAKAKPHVTERFGINQEVLVIYSPFAETDARILTAIEEISRKNQFRMRIEKIITILVHNGDQHQARALSSPDRIIIPFHAEELSGPSRGSIFVRSRIAEIIGPMNLFEMSSPIKSDKYLFGRDELIQTLVDRLCFRRENSGLFGLRKTGKTSVLFAVQRRIPDLGILTEYMDCQNPGLHGARWWQLLHVITERLLKRRPVKSMSKLHTYNPATAGKEFLDDVKEILEKGNVQQIAILLDEVEYITCGLSGAIGQHWDEDFVPFWQTIRSVHQETLGRFCFMVAGVNPAAVDSSHFGTTSNPIFQLAQPQYLSPLTTQQVRSMVRTIGRYAGLDFREEVYSYLRDSYGGHPYLIRLACSEVWKASDLVNPDKMTEVRISQFKSNKDHIADRLAQPIRDILLSLVWWYPEEYDVLRILATGDKSFVEDYLSQKPGTLTQFSKYGLLSENGDFAIPDIRDFLNRFGETYKSEVSPFARTDMPPALLPEIPDLEKLGRLFKHRCDVEIKLRRVIIMYLGMKCSWDPESMAQAMSRGIHKRADQPGVQELFVGRTPQQVINELYTLDLKSIVTANWDLFGTLFDMNKPRFEMNLDTINKARRVDAHTKPISEQEMEEFENSYSWVAGRLSKVASL